MVTFNEIISVDYEAMAAVVARNNYLGRFFCRYSMKETIELPDDIIDSGMYFIDNSYSERREKRRTKNIAVNQFIFNDLL